MMTDTPITENTEKYRDKIATVDEQGKRVWVYPKKPRGYFYNIRSYVSWGLLAILFGLPFIKVNGEPLVLFNILERNFIVFGLHFTPQDFHLFVLSMLTLIVFIVLFTVIFGRLFCGWVCPQTIFMEMVFRKIEYWIEGDFTAQKRLNEAPWTANKIRKKGLKQFLFIGVSVLIAHTFLSYIIGLDQVTQIITQSPLENIGGFMAMMIFTGVFYVVFSSMREQVCTTICPYGRLQGVLTDKNTILVSYDYVRGEPRGKLKKKKDKPVTHTSITNDCQNACTHCSNGQTCPSENLVNKIEESVVGATLKVSDFPPIVEERPLKLKGDCIDCKLCVKVCPTGIDIRDGIQLECINCTACIDACDGVMEKIGQEKGLIRYDSLNGIEMKHNKIFTPRVIAYTVVLVMLMITNIAMLGTRSDVEAVILRTPGMLYQKVDEHTISNLYNYQIFNKTSDEFPLTFQLEGIEGAIKWVGKPPVGSPNAMVEGAFFIEINNANLKGPKNKLVLQIYNGDELLDEVTTNFFGPR